MADDANLEPPIKQGTISQVYLKSNNAYYDVCDTKSREDIASLLDKIYPVGSIYMTMDNNFNPQTSFGGTWEKIQGKFLLGTSNNETSNTEGGNSQIQLNENQVPMKQHVHSMAHNHNISHTHGMGHTHTINHTHNVVMGSHNHDFNDFQTGGDHLSKDIFNSRRSSAMRTPDNQGYLPGWAYNSSDQGVIVAHATSGNTAGLRVQSKDLGTKVTGNPSTSNSGNSSRNETVGANPATSGNSSADNTGNAVASGSSENISPINIMPPYITVHMWRRTA